MANSGCALLPLADWLKTLTVSRAISIPPWLDLSHFCPRKTGGSQEFMKFSRDFTTECHLKQNPSLSLRLKDAVKILYFLLSKFFSFLNPRMVVCKRRGQFSLPELGGLGTIKQVSIGMLQRPSTFTDGNVFNKSYV